MKIDRRLVCGLDLPQAMSLATAIAYLMSKNPNTVEVDPELPKAWAHIMKGIQRLSRDRAASNQPPMSPEEIARLHLENLDPGPAAEIREGLERCTRRVTQ